MKCKQCDTSLGDFSQNAYRVVDIGSERVGIFCTEHGKELEEALKKERFAEEYKGEVIYTKDGKYFPYWGALYHFKTIEGARNRIDHPHIAIVSY